MEIIALIPARKNSTRLPNKLLQSLGNRSVISTTYHAVKSTGLFDDVWVVCDHEEIYNDVTGNGGKAIMSEGDFECGTDRIASVAKQFKDETLIINVQGDEPLTLKQPLELLINAMRSSSDVQVASLMEVIHEHKMVHNPNVVKVVTDLQHNLLLFSRAAIPFHRNMQETPVYYKHIGIYAFTKKALMMFARWPIGNLERIEMQEGLRFLENGISIKMLLTEYATIGIDTFEDLERARSIIKNSKNDT